jgi:hypothetical protein
VLEAPDGGTPPDGMAYLLRGAGSISRRAAHRTQFEGWQRLNAEYAKQFGIEKP